MSSTKLNNTDLKVLKVLQENSKITNLQLSKTVGLSPAPTLERVRKLEQAGVIKSYHAHLDPSKLGLNVQTFVLATLNCSDEDALKKFKKRIMDIPQVVEAHLITGEADCIMKVVTTDMATYEKILFKTLSQIPELERIKTLMTLSTIKDTPLMPLDYNLKS